MSVVQSHKKYHRRIQAEPFRWLTFSMSNAHDPHEGRERWTLKMLANEMVRLEYVDDISYETVRRTLKKTI